MLLIEGLSEKFSLGFVLDNFLIPFFLQIFQIFFEERSDLFNFFFLPHFELLFLLLFDILFQFLRIFLALLSQDVLSLGGEGVDAVFEELKLILEVV